MKNTLSILVVVIHLAGLTGCGGGPSGGAPPPGDPAQIPVPQDPGRIPAPSRANPVGLAFRQAQLPPPAPPDGRDYRSPEFMGHHGLAAISADEAYRRGYFGQGVRIAVADDGMDLTHPDLAGRITAPRHLRNRNADVFEVEQGVGTGHGTYVAMIAAGARGNPGERFAITAYPPGSATPTRIPTKNAHGVAPQATIMPIAIAGAQPVEALRYAAANRAQVLNLSLGLATSYYGKFEGREGVWLTTQLPLFRPLLELDLGENTPALAYDFAEAAAALRGADMVAVWATGNNGWNSLNNELRMCGKNFREEDGCELGEGPVSAVEFMEKFSWLYDPNDSTRSVSFKEMWGTGCGSDSCAEYNSPGEWLEAPSFEPGLLGKWLAVGALGKDGRIARFSNACGAARNWCLFAPGEDLALGPGGEGISGTSFAAPFVSGALAVLRSRLRGMPMEVVQAVLLASADPMGTRLSDPDEPDPVYGWGRLNLGRAILMQGSVRLPFSVSDTTRSAPLRDARVILSPALAHVGRGLGSVPVAVGDIRGAYYNMALSRIVDVERPGSRLPALTHAAAGMLEPAGGRRYGNDEISLTADPASGGIRSLGWMVSGGVLGNGRFRYSLCDGCERSPWREWDALDSRGAVAAAPFFAGAGDSLAYQAKGYGVRPFAALSGKESTRAPWWQFGLRWRMDHGGFGIVAEVSHIDESRSFWGTLPGPLGKTRTETRQGRLLLSRALDANWRAFLAYEGAAGKVFTSGGMLSGVSGLRAAGWSGGTEGRGVFVSGDSLRFSARQKTGVRSGSARISHVVATGAGFAQAFYQGASQSLEQREVELGLRARRAAAWALGYSLPHGEMARFAVGLEYESETRTTGFSLGWQRKF